MTGKATRDIDEVSGIIIDGNIKLIRIRLAASGDLLTVVKAFGLLRLGSVCEGCNVVFFNSLYSNVWCELRQLAMYRLICHW
jgi:hypothetical protein